MSLNAAQLVQGSIEWLAFRVGKIGSSDAPVIMGVSKFKTALQLYEEMKGLAPLPEVTWPMKRGTELEPDARDWYINNQGIQMFPTVKVHPEHDFLIASMDGVSFSEKIGLEIKCPVNARAKVDQIIENGIPDDYYAQIQHQMMVCGMDHIDLVIFDGKYGQVFPVERDNEYIERLMKAELEFYQCLLDDIPPRSPFYTEDLDIQDLVEPIRRSNERLKLEQEINDGLKERLKELCGYKNTQVKGMNVIFKTQRGNVDYGKIPELKDVELDKYRRPSFIKTMIEFS